MDSFATDISVLLPFTGRSPFLKEAITSILAQSHEARQILLLANGASAESIAVAQRFAQAHPSVELHVWPTADLCSTLNKGWEMARCTWIARMDADDIAHRDRFKKQIAFARQNRAVEAIGVQTQLLGQAELAAGFVHYIHWQNSLLSAEEHALNRFVESPVAHPGMLFKRALLQYGFYAQDDIPEDYELWLRWMDAGVKMAKVPEVLLYWRDHKERLSRTNQRYARESFDRVRMHYLAKWLHKHLPPDQCIVLCGSGAQCRRRAALLEAEGIPVEHFTDVVPKTWKGKKYLPLEQISTPDQWMVISLLSARGVGAGVKSLFVEKGFEPGKNFWLAG